MTRPTGRTGPTASTGSDAVGGVPIEAMVRVRLPGTVRAGAFEAWASSRRTARALWALIGDDDYEVWLRCPDLAALDAELTLMRREGGAERTSTSLVLREAFARAAEFEEGHDGLDLREESTGARGVAGYRACPGRR